MIFKFRIGSRKTLSFRIVKGIRLNAFSKTKFYWGSDSSTLQVVHLHNLALYLVFIDRHNRQRSGPVQQMNMNKPPPPPQAGKIPSLLSIVTTPRVSNCFMIYRIRCMCAGKNTDDVFRSPVYELGHSPVIIQYILCFANSRPIPRV